MANPAKPTNLKVLQGTFRHDRGAKSEPRPEVEIPPVPAGLNDEAKVEWGKISQELAQLGLLTRIDRAALAIYCETWGDWVEATAKCKTENGQDRKVIRTAQGNFVENPYFSIKKRCAEILHRYIVEFGLSPASRTKINASPLPADKPGNKFGNL